MSAEVERVVLVAAPDVSIIGERATYRREGESGCFDAIVISTESVLKRFVPSMDTGGGDCWIEEA